MILHLVFSLFEIVRTGEQCRRWQELALGEGGQEGAGRGGGGDAAEQRGAGGGEEVSDQGG